VVFVLEELGVPYEIISFKFDNVKKKPFIDINPNGRVPGKSFLFLFFQDKVTSNGWRGFNLKLN